MLSNHMKVILHILNGKYAHRKTLHSYCFQMNFCMNYIINIVIGLLTKNKKP